MPDIKKQLGKQFTRAMFDATSIDVANRTVDVVFATETPVLKSSWDGMINEVLVCNTANVRMDRMNAGAPLLDTHDKYSVKTQLGVIESAKIVKGEARATIRFSKRADVEPVWQDVQDGILRNISVGYRVYEYDITERLDQSIPEYRAVDWEPLEISLVPVPADPNSGVRSQEDIHEVKINSNKNLNTMPENAPAATAETRSENAPAATAPASTTPAATAPVADTRSIADSPKRASQILFAVRAAGLDMDYAQELIDNESITADGARSAIISKLADRQSVSNTRSANVAAVVPGGDVADKIRNGMTAAILQRSAPHILKPNEIEMAADYRGMDLMDMARTCVENAGISTKGKMQREIASSALNVGERQLSISDFPNILGNTINRTLRAAYDNAPRTFMPWTHKKNAKDFRDMVSTTLGDLAGLLKVVEGAEYKQTTLGEGAERYRVAKYGTMINITWETLINDDLGAFERIPSKLAQAAANTQSDIMYAILNDNAALADTVPLFHATHGNLAGTGTAISVVSLGAARAAMRKQKGLGGTFLNLVPKFLIVGPDKEMEALQFTSSMYTSTKGTDINVWVGMLTVIVEPRIIGNTWYIAADPASMDTIEYAFLDGEELFTEQRYGFEVDGMQTKVRMVFGAKAIDFRALYKNAGN
jgi:hypothetical protein